ncbi:MAG TPA: bifunctional glutamate N-acetyltransferase/amino-acid acetyltransferase ArgJ [Polyangiales bacterium]|jgi:glutamate N-acetyltransferase/amino-acid N-acetyltransferase|nr:bifunctional glutamate N-acetyltransferase/amino-acid acetyltransferase ArgJ [Polyangiales bacterium]
MSTSDFEWVDQGGVTSPLGFKAGAVHAGIKGYADPDRFDLALLAADGPCSVAGVFTKNRVCGAPVTVCRERVPSGRARALVVNSGCSNVAMGERGLADAHRMTELAAKLLGIPTEEVLVGSTGVIGRPLPMDKISAGIAKLTLSRDSGIAFSRAIMTTDTVNKSRALRVTIDGVTYTVGGAAKGAGMVHPDMATVFGFFTTDANVPAPLLQTMLRDAADASFNMVDVDMDTSTSDTMLLFASGAAGGPAIVAGSPAAAKLSAAITALAIELGRDLARDGEGARTLIEMTVEGARTLEDARRAARTVVSSPLVKTMITGRDANLGRVMMALGRSGAELEVSRISVWIGGQCAFRSGAPTELDLSAIKKAMDAPEVKLRADLGLGDHKATAWGCDLTEGYVRINADYTT